MLDHKTVKSILDEHFNSKVNRRLLIWSLLSVEFYLNAFSNNNFPLNYKEIFTMKIFITGVTGFIGSKLCDYLGNRNEIYGLIRNQNMRVKILKQF